MTNVATRVVLAAIVGLGANACAGAPDVAIGPEPAPTTSAAPTTVPVVPPLQRLSTEVVASGLTEPVAMASSPELGFTLVAERTGSVVSLADDGPSLVLDITDRVGWDINEQGLLGIALHPRFPDDPRAFVIYTDDDRDVNASSFTWTGTAFDPDSESVILHVPQPHQYHQGGGITFGPYGYLWMSFGDGGGNADRYDNGQNPKTLNGTIVRIDVDNAEPYAIPPTNPFASGDGGAPEVWAYGLRNPWRITIDTGSVLIADVGQYTAEEINRASVDDGGLNFGWPITEGAACFESDECDTTGLTPPAIEISHRGTCALIGGPVYRGTAIPEIHGHYVYGDFCTGWIRTVPTTGTGFGEPIDWQRDLGRLGQLSTFGIDAHGEILIGTLEGTIHRIIPIR